MKWVGVVIGLIASFSASAQYSLGGGASTLFQFGNGKPFAGLHFTAEFPRNNEVTFYGRLTYHFKQNNSESALDSNGDPYYFYATAFDNATNPFVIPLNASFTESMNYVIIDGGTRYYLINGYDEGFALYGATNIAVIINSMKYRYTVEDYDKSKYFLNNQDERLLGQNKGTILNLAAGLTGGAKYTFPGVGTVYFDINPSLIIFGLPSKEGIETTLYKNVAFNFSLGFRKEFY